MSFYGLSGFRFDEKLLLSVLLSLTEKFSISNSRCVHLNFTGGSSVYLVGRQRNVKFHNTVINGVLRSLALRKSRSNTVCDHDCNVYTKEKKHRTLH